MKTKFFALTGSIGMGKSTTAQMFRDECIPVHDADATVHELYQNEAVLLVEQAFPGTTGKEGVDREKLSKFVLGKPEELQKLERIVHPLVGQKERAFREKVEGQDKPLAILDIPLLFETGGEGRVDGVIVVTAPSEVQRQRVLERPGMNEEKLRAILARQVPDAIKREKADFVIDTSLGLDHARSEVKKIIAKLSAKA